MNSSDGEHSSGAGWAVSRQPARSMGIKSVTAACAGLHPGTCCLFALVWLAWHGVAWRGSLTPGSVQPQRAGLAV